MQSLEAVDGILAEREQMTRGLEQEHKQKLADKFRGRLLSILEAIEHFCVGLGLDSAVDKAHRIKKGSLEESAYSLPELQTAFRELRERIEDGVYRILLISVPRSKAVYVREKQLFGQKVEDKFPGAGEDIEEAGKCFALGRYTACVFHLMRVMEKGVQELANKLGARVDVEKEPWGKILTAISDAIKRRPTKTSRQKKFHSDCEEIAASLHAVKDAWRNPTMHPKKTYTEEEVDSIFHNVRAFMQRLAEIV
jgi:hypothetical protein